MQRVIDPDGSLNLVSFARSGNSAARVRGERWTISYVSSGRDLLVGADTATSRRGSSCLGKSDFDLEPPTSRRKVEETCRRQGDHYDFRGLSFGPYREQRRKVKSCGLALPPLASATSWFTSARKRPKRLRRVQSPYILHLATHGFLLPAPTPSKPDPGTLAHAPASMEGWAALANPMVRSGLALAGAQNSVTRWARGEDVAAENDGIVTAQEIATLNLRNTWLVVLSACDSGVGKIEVGEGVLGLRRGFIQAGAKNLLLTLWPVDDELTTGIIDDFYTEAGRSRDPCRALGEVQKSWLKRLRQQSGLEEACRVAGAFILTCHDRLR
ncbi:MAG: CHAT domain-containing protein [Verrucomicrobiota bacterium]